MCLILVILKWHWKWTLHEVYAYIFFLTSSCTIFALYHQIHYHDCLLMGNRVTGCFYLTLFIETWYFRVWIFPCGQKSKINWISNFWIAKISTDEYLYSYQENHKIDKRCLTVYIVQTVNVFCIFQALFRKCDFLCEIIFKGISFDACFLLYPHYQIYTVWLPVLRSEYNSH